MKRNQIFSLFVVSTLIILAGCNGIGAQPTPTATATTIPTPTATELPMLFLDRKTIWPAILVEISSLLSYINWLYDLPVNLTEISFWINIGLVLWIILWYGKKLTSPAVTPDTLEPQPNMRS